MQSISTIGLDIAKSVFQVHGVDVAGQVGVMKTTGALPGATPHNRRVSVSVPWFDDK
jgi:hypothetical protein